MAVYVKAAEQDFETVRFWPACPLLPHQQDEVVRRFEVLLKNRWACWPMYERLIDDLKRVHLDDCRTSRGETLLQDLPRTAFDPKAAALLELEGITTVQELCDLPRFILEQMPGIGLQVMGQADDLYLWLLAAPRDLDDED